MSVRTNAIERDRPKLTGRAAALLVVVTMLALMSLVPIRGYLAQRARIDDLERQAAALEQANDRLRADITRLHDPVYLEQLARECLGLVEPGETALVRSRQPGASTLADC